MLNIARMMVNKSLGLHLDSQIGAINHGLFIGLTAQLHSTRFKAIDVDKQADGLCQDSSFLVIDRTMP